MSWHQKTLIVFCGDHRRFFLIEQRKGAIDIARIVDEWHRKEGCDLRRPVKGVDWMLYMTSGTTCSDTLQIIAEHGGDVKVDKFLNIIIPALDPDYLILIADQHRISGELVVGSCHIGRNTEQTASGKLLKNHFPVIAGVNLHGIAGADVLGGADFFGITTRPRSSIFQATPVDFIVLLPSICTPINVGVYAIAVYKAAGAATRQLQKGGSQDVAYIPDADNADSRMPAALCTVAAPAPSACRPYFYAVRIQSTT